MRINKITRNWTGRGEEKRSKDAASPPPSQLTTLCEQRQQQQQQTILTTYTHFVSFFSVIFLIFHLLFSGDLCVCVLLLCFFFKERTHFSCYLRNLYGHAHSGPKERSIYAGKMQKE